MPPSPGLSAGTQRLPVIVLGAGNVGLELLAQIVEGQSRFPWLALCGVGDSSGLLLLPEGFPPEVVRGIIRHKREGGGLEGLGCGAESGRFVPAGEAQGSGLPAHLRQAGIQGAIVADVTASQEAYRTHLALRQEGHHTVLANKWPLAVPYEQYTRLWEAGGGTATLRHEATVGAALPIISTLDNLITAGDTVEEIQASVSGTLGYITNALDRDVPFSRAVRESYDLGYTEPDPRIDLSGVDVARKLLILARKMGRQLDMESIRIESLTPPQLEAVPLQAFWSELPRYDGEIARRVGAARGEGHVLRYLGVVGKDRQPVAQLESVGAKSVFATAGAASVFVFRTGRYHEQPLIVQGPGAGAALTAGAVLADIVYIGARCT